MSEARVPPGARNGEQHQPPDESEERTSLDLLENEDRRILVLTTEMDAARSTTVLDRADYGNRAKLFVRHVATREAALLDVAGGLGRAGLEELGRRFTGDLEGRRTRFDALERMSRGIQGIALNTGQDFEGALEALLGVLRPEIEWDLAEGVAEVRSVLDPQRQESVFSPAVEVARHAPTHLDPKGARWWERMPVVSRVVAGFTHLRDYPSATRDSRT